MFASSELPRSTRILAWTRRMLQCPQEGISWWYMQWISLLLWQYFLCMNISVLCTTAYVKHMYTYACIIIYPYSIYLYLLSQPLRIYQVIVRCTNVTQWRLLRLQAKWGYSNLVHELLKQELRINICKVCYPCLYAYMRIGTIIDIYVCIRLYCILLLLIVKFVYCFLLTQLFSLTFLISISSTEFSVLGCQERREKLTLWGSNSRRVSIPGIVLGVSLQYLKLIFKQPTRPWFTYHEHLFVELRSRKARSACLWQSCADLFA